MINYTANFFKLDLLKISEIKLHETTECSRLRNIFDRISKSNYLMNPVIVGKHKNDFLLIDGANRLSTLKEIGCKLAIAQVINYTDNKIKLKKWNHLVYELDIEKIIEFCKSKKLEFENINHSHAENIQKNGFHYIIVSVIKKNATILIHLPKNFNAMLKELNLFTKYYFGNYNFDRSEEEIKISELKKHTRKKGILIEFPDFNKNQIIEIANNKHKIPAGITRHILNNRVLHLRYELWRLMDDKNIEQKKKDLEKYLNNKIDNNKVRQYRESVIVFDE